MGEMTRIQAEGGEFDAYVAPADPAGPPVLLLHAWWGLTQQIKDMADRFAAAGFTVLAPDLFNGTVLTTIEEAEAHGEDEEAMSGRYAEVVVAALDSLLARQDVTGDKAAVIGFSFGVWYGTQVAEARPEVTAMVNIYGGMVAPDDVAFLGHFAENDPFVDSSKVPALQEMIGDRGQAHLYPGTAHWFLEEDRPEYDPAAAELAMGRTVEFLRSSLG
jgi:carboxymethylenebutenolidase